MSWIDHSIGPDEAEDVRTVSLSGYFDREFYSLEAGLPFDDDRIAITHYLTEGWRLGLNPSNLFDTTFYFESNYSVRESGCQPLLHFLRDGRALGLGSRLARAPLAARARHPSVDALVESRRERPPRPADDRRGPIVVVRASEGRPWLAALASVLDAGSHDVVLWIDGSDTEIARQADRLRAMHGVSVVADRRDLSDRLREAALQGTDVVALGGGTEVYNDWAQRLRRAIRDRIGAAVPLSTAAGPLSYPYPGADNRQTFETSFETIDRLCGDVGSSPKPIHVLPEGCRYFAAACIAELGQDADAVLPDLIFGDDVVDRLLALGWDIVACPNVFVRTHVPARRIGSRESGRRHAEIDLTAERARIDLARAARLSEGRGILFVSHHLGGGIERHVATLANHLVEEGVAVFMARPHDGGRAVAFSALGGIDLPNLPAADLGVAGRLGEIARALAIRRVHIHSLVGWPLDDARALITELKTAEISYDITIHDYAAVCPRLHMVDWSGIYCGSESRDHCRECIARVGSEFGPVDIGIWREHHQRILQGARRIIVPDPDVDRRLRQYVRVPVSSFLRRPHPFNPEHAAPTLSGRAPPVLTVGVIGGIGWNKGYSVLLGLVADAFRRSLPMKFVVYGFTHPRDVERFPNIQVTGRYRDEDIGRIISETPCDMAFFPAVGPETFCFALDIAFHNRLFPVAFDIGATARRIREAGWGDVLPLGLALDPERLNDELLRLKPRPPPAAWPEQVSVTWQGAEHYYDTR